MRAVNLIPAEARRSGGSGTGAFVLLGVLGLLVVMASVYALSTKTVSDRQAELERVQAEAVVAEAQAAQLSSYVAFDQLSRDREATVKQLVQTRFDWAHAMHEVARTIPSGVTLATMRGTVSASSSVGGGGSAGGLRGALDVPAVELTGCTTSQSRVATIIASLRRIDGVQRVSLVSSAKADETEGSAAGQDAPIDDSAQADAGCTSDSKRPQFSIVVFFTQPTAAAPAATGSAAATTPTASTGSAQ